MNDPFVATLLSGSHWPPTPVAAAADSSLTVARDDLVANPGAPLPRKSKNTFQKTGRTTSVDQAIRR